MRIPRLIFVLSLMAPPVLFSQTVDSNVGQSGGVSTEFPVDHERYIPGLSDLQKKVQDSDGSGQTESGFGEDVNGISSLWNTVSSDKTVANGIILLILVAIFVVYKLKSGNRHGR
jgi:hypothetical protein